MKTLLLIRHAKSDWADASLNDFERPLNERGKISIDAFISSPAKRAGKTAGIFAKEYKQGKENIIFKEELYGAASAVFFNVVTQVDNRFESIAIFSHNPGITDFANQLTDARIDNIPTCGIFAITIDADTWADFLYARKNFWFFDYPKNGG
jgi:phosphohistidine phosphatase